MGVTPNLLGGIVGGHAHAGPQATNPTALTRNGQLVGAHNPFHERESGPCLRFSQQMLLRVTALLLRDVGSPIRQNASLDCKMKRMRQAREKNL